MVEMTGRASHQNDWEFQHLQIYTFILLNSVLLYHHFCYPADHFYFSFHLFPVLRDQFLTQLLFEEGDFSFQKNSNQRFPKFYFIGCNYGAKIITVFSSINLIPEYSQCVNIRFFKTYLFVCVNILETRSSLYFENFSVEFGLA